MPCRITNLTITINLQWLWSIMKISYNQELLSRLFIIWLESEWICPRLIPSTVTTRGGRAAYDPAILLKIILFAYSKGITSSREIAWCCETNILFKALSCDTTPHFTTIANFVSSYPKAIETLFEQVLLICHEEGLLGNELFAIDAARCHRMRPRSGRVRSVS